MANQDQLAKKKRRTGPVTLRNKKAKTKKTTSTTKPEPHFSMISTETYSKHNRKQLRDQFCASKPYTHCVLESVCEPARLREVLRELRDYVPATLKESDLFKVYQSIGK
jgi:hypothetical protein